jgi:hypothetical protein
MAQNQDAALLAQAESLINAGRGAEAFALLEPREIDLAGSPPYDYLLGVAALDAGRPRDAAFALERVVAADPGFVGARMDLARAFYALGEYDAARTQFRYLEAQNPPPATRAAITQYLAAIDAETGGVESRWGALFAAGVGYDTNANASTSDDDFLGFTLLPDNVETSSGFAEVSAGVGNALAVGRDFGLVTNLELEQRWNPDASFVDQTIASFSTTALRRRGNWRLSASLGGFYGWLDGEEHDWTARIDAGAALRFATSWEFSLSARAGTLQYVPDALAVLDVDQYFLGLGLTRLDIGESAGRVGLVLIGGQEEARQDGSPYGNDQYGARLFAGWLLRPQASLYLEASALETEYDGLFFGATRDDTQYGAVIALELQNWPAARWNLTPRVRYVNHESTVSLYEYDRVEAGLYVRRSF